ncbi:MAG: dihydropteroate synthase [Candidatus Schekmanbacteria bacterium]|nr:dihydropteroate synthase [Candidatus Schekmanbacteria bacterium]
MLIKCGNYNLDLGKRTHIMGILNVTPDSFSDGGKFLEPGKAVKQALQMVEDGADIIDIGAESSRPGAQAIDVEEELERLLPILRLLVKKLPVPVSVDTYKYPVAQAVLDLGVQIINDITGLRSDPPMADLIARYDAGLVLMHMLGTPQNMQDNPHYAALMPGLIDFFKVQIDYALDRGISAAKIIIDPGIGFGKTIRHNLQIIKHLDRLKIFEKPILLGASRKSFIGKILNLPVDQREEGTAATVTYGILQGANIVRVHDVKAMSRVVRMTDAIMSVD